MSALSDLADEAAKAMREKKLNACQAVGLACRGKDERVFKQVCAELGRRAAAHRLAMKHGQQLPAHMWNQESSPA